MIVPMKRVTLAAMRSEEGPILEALQKAAVVEIIPSEEGGADAARRSVFEARIQRLRSAGNALKPYAAKESFFSAKPVVELDELMGNAESGLATAEKVEKLTAELAALKSEDTRLADRELSLVPWLDLKTPLQDIAWTRSAVLAPYIARPSQLPAIREIEGLDVEVISEDSRAAILVACHRDDWQEAERRLKVLETQEVSFAGFTGTATENLNAIYDERMANHQRQTELVAALTEVGLDAAGISRAADAAAVELDRTGAEGEVLKTDAVFILEGWVRSDEVDKTEAAVKSVTDAYYSEYRDPTDEEIPPSVVKNNKLVQPYEAVVGLYSKPDPRGIDGAPLMAPFYFLFFGMMMGDLGYGLLLTLIAALYIKLKKPVSGSISAGIIRVIFWGGISTMFCSFFIGTCFGLDLDAVFGTVDVFPLLFDFAVDSMPALILCFGLGLVHMLVGMTVGMIENFKHGDPAAAIVDNLSWIVIILGILLFAGPSFVTTLPAFLSTVGMVMAIAGAATVLLFAGRGKKNIFGRVVSGAGKLYDITSYLSDMLSYARIFALGLSTGILASVMNMLAGMITSALSGNAILAAIGYIIAAAVLAFAHLFTLALNALGTFIHAARLQYVEYFNKFYVAGGRDFLPLRYRTKSVTVKE